MFLRPNVYRFIPKVRKQSSCGEVAAKGEGLFSISIFAISIAQEDFSVFDFKDAVIGQSYAVGVATIAVNCCREISSMRLFQTS